MDNIQLTLESSTTSLSLNSDSIYLNPEIDGLAGLPEIRTTSGVNAGYNGGWTSAQFYDARLITIRGVISNSDISVVEDRRKALVGLLGQGRKEELTLHFVTAGGNSYVLNCRTISCEMALSGLARKQEFLIQLRADDPLIYDDGALATEAIVNVRRALGGFQIDFGLPLYIGGGVNETLVENGNETVYPVINLYGPLHSPTIINQTTNQQMQVLTDLDYTLTWVNPVEVTGDYILVTNETDKESPLSSVELLGNTTQDTLSGKNLLRLPDAGGSSGITYSINNDGTFNLHGTNSAGYEVLFTYYIDSTEFQSTNYTLSANKALPDGAAVRLEIYSGTTWKRSFVSVNNSRQSQTATPDFTGANRVRVAVCVGSGKTVNIDNLGVMLEKSSSATSFEKYCGGIPSPNPDYPQAVQTTTGEQVVKMTGKNLFNYADRTFPFTAQGITASLADDGTVTITGVPTSDYVRISNANQVDITELLEDGATYTFSASTISTDFYAEVAAKRNTSGTDYYGTRGVASKTFTVDKSTHKTYKIYSTTYTKSGWGTASKTISQKFQLEKSSSASDFEPYQSQSYEVNLGKNLFDGETVNGWLNSSGVLQSSTSDRTSTNYIAVQPNTTYTLHGTNSTYLKFTQFNGSKTAVSQQTTTSATTLTTTTGASTAYVRIGWGNASSASNVQLEIGQATTYAAYFTPIELCKLGDYQDKIYKSGDDWYVHKEVGRAMLDTLTWDNYNNTVIYAGGIASALGIANLGNPTLAIASNVFTATNSTSTTWRFLYNGSNNHLNTYGDSAYLSQTGTQAKQWMTDHNAVIYYALATPTDTQITNQTLIDQLDALASSTLFVGVNNIALVPSGGAQGGLTVEYFSAYTEERDIVVIDSQARTITKNGADIYYLKADGSEFPTLAPGENTLYLTSEQTSDEGYAEIKFKQGYLSI